MLSSNHSQLSREQLQQLRRFDTCTLSNAIERFNVRPRNEGFMRGTVTCRFPRFAPVLGYAVTARVRSSMVPIKGRCYYEHPDFWQYVASSPRPLIMVVEDAEEQPAVAALFGEAYACISRALGAVACITNGAVRDIPAIEALGFQLFSHGVAVSHAYSHVVEFGEPVEIGGLKISPGDLLHGDLHGVHQIPIHVAAELPRIAEQVLEEDRELFELTESKDFSVETLSARIQGIKSHL